MKPSHPALVDLAPIGILLLDPALRIVHANPAARRLLDEEASPAGRDLAGLLHARLGPALAAHMVESLRRTLATGEPSEVAEVPRLRGHGGVAPTDVRIHRAPLPDGREGLACYLTDSGERVEARRRLEASAAALRESDERLRLILDSARDFAFITLDTGGLVTGWSEGARHLLGYEAGEVLGRNGRILFTPEDIDRKAPERELDTALATGKASDERWHVRKDGSRFWGSGLVMALRRGDEPPHGLLKIMRDRTERVQAEQRLLEREEQFRRALEEAPIPVIMQAEDGEVLQVNAAWTALTGYTVRDAEVLAGWLDTAYGFGAEAVREAARRLFANDGRSLPPVEFTVVPRSGEPRRWLFSASAPGVLADGRRFIVGMAQDITERTRAEEELRRRIAQFATLLNRAPLGVFLVDGRLRALQVNPTALSFAGDPPGGILGREVGAVMGHLFREDAVEEIVGAFRHTLETGESVVVDEWIRERIDRGCIESYQWRIDRIPLADADGGPHGVVCYFRDISGQVRARHEREALLESERAARSDADRAARLKDEFLAILSHELRAPLNAILGWTHLLRLSADDRGKVLQSAAVIERNARAQARLVADLLEMSRILSGKLGLEVAPLDAAALVEGVAQSLRPAAEAKGLRLETRLPPMRGMLLGDAARIEQIVTNLVLNSIKFTPGGGLVEVSLREADGRLEIVVRDTGEGIDPEFLPVLFDRFRQADASIARRYGGLGLGLALVRQLAELHGGTVEARSEGRGRGSTFVVRLPLAIDETGAIREAGAEPPAAAPRLDLAGVRVLAVDDDPDALEMMRRVLEDSGAEVVTAPGADQALEHLEHDPVDVIVSDIGMPERDGFEMMREARRRGVRTPAAALTAFARPEDRDKALRSGYQAHLSKPMDPAKLLTTVATMSGRQEE